MDERREQPERETPEDLLEEFLVAENHGGRPDPASFESRLADADSRSRFRDLLDRAAEATALFPVRVRSGALLAGRYVLTSELGSGGYGRVWLAVDQRLGDQLVAIKVLNGLVTSHGAQQDLEREKRALERIEHEGIVRIRDVGEHDGSPFLVLDYVRGMTIRALIEGLDPEERLLPPPDPSLLRRILPRARISDDDWWRFCARIVRELCDALAAAHECGIVHRDLKPQNVMIREDGRVVLLDFGLAGLRDQTRGSLTSRLVGTLNYLAPEQLVEERTGFDVHTDVYQTGLVLYEMLTFRPAFPGNLPIGEVLQGIKTGDVRRPRAIAVEVPQALEDACLRSIERLPEHRYHSARSVADDLDDFLAGRLPRGIQRNGLSRTGRSLRRLWGRRRVPILIAGATSIGVVLGVAALAASGANVRIADAASIVGDVVRATVHADRDGLLFARLRLVDAFGVERGQIPLVSEEGKPSIAVTAGVSELRMRLPPRVPIPGGVPQVMVMIPGDDRAAQLAEVQRLLTEWIVEKREGNGVPPDVLRQFADEARLGARAAGVTKVLSADELVGRDWVRSPIGRRP